MNKPLLSLDAARAFDRSPAQLSAGLLSIKAAAKDQSAEVYIYGDIGGYWDGVEAEQFVKDLAALDVETMNVHINSPGGLVFDGVAIYNALVTHKATVNVQIEGIAASIASVIAMAGDEIAIGESANLMIHKPWSGVMGTADDMRKQAEVLDELEAGLIDIYSARTGKTSDQLSPLLSAETWFRGQSAVDEGFADKVIPNKQKKAARSALLNHYSHTPIDLRNDNAHSPQVREFERLLREGENCSGSQAKRLAALAARLFKNAPRDEDVEQVATLGDALQRAEALAATIRSLTL